MAKIVYACARFTSLKKRLPQSYVGKRGYVHSESGTGKMRAKMVVQFCSDQWKSITILNRFTSSFDTKLYAAETGNKVFMYQDIIGHDLT